MLVCPVRADISIDRFRVVSWNDYKKAFTLAEVLITLGIIGVVAAMTIPTLMTKIQNRVINNQFRSAYSKIYQALRLVESSEEALPACYYVKHPFLGNDTWAGCSLFYTILAKRMKVMQTCEGNAYAKGCIPKYRGVDDIALENNPDADIDYINRNCRGYNTSSLLNSSRAYVLIDGTIIITYGAGIAPLFAVDVNGKKGPNRWGYDIFGLMIVENINGSISIDTISGGCAPIEKGGRSSADMMRQIR